MYVFHLGIYYGVQALLTNRFHVKYPLPTAYGLLYFAALLGLTYGLAWLSFNCFESWFLGLKRFFEPAFPQEPKTLSTSEIESKQQGRELLRHQTV
jgi:peptidoglycan/LPS O-acetylase OafA/YrhL